LSQTMVQEGTGLNRSVSIYLWVYVSEKCMP
jgi:hypothetical protein